MKALIEHITSELSAIDTDQAYDDMLDEIYSLESVGGPFAYMSASKVLCEVDPTAYRCGFSDYTAFSQREVWAEVDGNYYDRRDAEKAKQEFISELQAKAEKIEAELECLDQHPDSPEYEKLDNDFTLAASLVKEAEGFDL